MTAPSEGERHIGGLSGWRRIDRDESRLSTPEKPRMTKLALLFATADMPVNMSGSPTRRPSATGSPPPKVKVPATLSAATLVNCVCDRAIGPTRVSRWLASMKSK